MYALKNVYVLQRVKSPSLGIIHTGGVASHRGDAEKKLNIRERVAQGRIPSRQRDKSEVEFKVDRLDSSGPPVDRRCVRSAVKTDVQPPTPLLGTKLTCVCVCVCTTASLRLRTCDPRSGAKLTLTYPSGPGHA